MKTKKKIFMAGRYFTLVAGIVFTLSACGSQSSVVAAAPARGTVGGAAGGFILDSPNVTLQEIE